MSKKLSELICNMLLDGLPQHSVLDGSAEHQLLVRFCVERSRNIAMAMPELLAESEYDYEKVVSGARESADRIMEKFLGPIFSAKEERELQDGWNGENK